MHCFVKPKISIQLTYEHYNLYQQLNTVKIAIMRTNQQYIPSSKFSVQPAKTTSLQVFLFNIIFIRCIIRYNKKYPGKAPHKSPNKAAAGPAQRFHYAGSSAEHSKGRC